LRSYAISKYRRAEAGDRGIEALFERTGKIVGVAVVRKGVKLMPKPAR